MDYLVVGVFAAVCALIYWLLIRHQTNKMIKQIQKNTKCVIDEMNQETRQFIEELTEIQRSL